MNVEETVYGMRIDTFLADAEILSEEDKQHHKTVKEQKIIQKRLAEVLKHNNRLPD